VSSDLTGEEQVQVCFGFRENRKRRLRWWWRTRKSWEKM